MSMFDFVNDTLPQLSEEGVVSPIVKDPQCGTVYTCPMHPEIRQDSPGSCPKRGMSQEPVGIAAVEAQVEYFFLRDVADFVQVTKKLPDVWHGRGTANQLTLVRRGPSNT